MKIQIEKSLQGTIKLAVLLFEGLNCQSRNDRLWQEIEQLAIEYHHRFSEPSQASDLLKPGRDLYRKIGIEPTKTRPSSEALLRRAIKVKPLYQVNSIVDVGNLCSLKFFLPIGLYDLSKISGQVILRKGKKGEEFQGIRKETIHVEGRYTLCDELGAFGNPSSDSLRTSLRLNTTDLVFVIYAPFDYPENDFKSHTNFAGQKMLNFHHGRLVNKATVI